MESLRGKVAVITGGSSGLGLAAARKFVDLGAYGANGEACSRYLSKSWPI